MDGKKILDVREKKKFTQFWARMQKLWQFYGGIIKSGFQEELRLGFDG